MKVLVTGANGFVGSHLCKWLVRPTVPITRNEIDLETATEKDWMPYLDGVDAVVHCAARVHQLKESNQQDLGPYQKINIDASVTLAKAAKKAGVKRFIFLSTVLVNGNRTFDKPFTAEDDPNPANAYAKSKWLAEQALREVAPGLTILRPPLVYGRGVKGNFRLLQRLAKLPVLPLDDLKGKRSMIHIDNLCSLIAMSLDSDKTIGKTYLVGDGFDMTVPYILRQLNPKIILFPIPSWVLRLGCQLIGRPGIADRLLNSLQVDATPITYDLAWFPPPVDVGDMTEGQFQRLFQ